MVPFRWFSRCSAEPLLENSSSKNRKLSLPFDDCSNPKLRWIHRPTQLNLHTSFTMTAHRTMNSKQFP